MNWEHVAVGAGSVLVFSGILTVLNWAERRVRVRRMATKAEKGATTSRRLRLRTIADSLKFVREQGEMRIEVKMVGGNRTYNQKECRVFLAMQMIRMLREDLTRDEIDDLVFWVLTETDERADA